MEKVLDKIEKILSEIRKIIIILLIISIGLYFGFKKNVDNYIQKQILPKFISYYGNDYYQNNNYEYFKENNNLVAYDREDVINILYTFINKGTENFTFYCDPNYFGCNSDINELMESKDTIIYINDFVHPYNSFSNINASVKENKINVNITKNYTNSDIINLNNIIKEIINETITDNMTEKEKIKALHDYLIMNITYDTEYAEDINNNIKNDSDSNKATGALIKNKAVCSGYSDALSIMLNYLGIKNIKISNEIHVWNYVYVDNAWYHIDVTNDDYGDEISTRFFLVNTDTIKYDNKHNFSKYVYSEFQR